MGVLEHGVGLHQVQIKALGDDVRIRGRLENSFALEKVAESEKPAINLREFT
jgi:hypothetical protein